MQNWKLPLDPKASKRGEKWTADRFVKSVLSTIESTYRNKHPVSPILTILYGIDDYKESSFAVLFHSSKREEFFA